MATTSTDHRIKVPDGLTLGDLLDAIDRDERNGQRLIDHGRESAQPDTYATEVVLEMIRCTADEPVHLARRTMRCALARYQLITMAQADYDHLATMAAERADAVEHARRLAAECSADDDGPVAA